MLTFRRSRLALPSSRSLLARRPGHQDLSAPAYKQDSVCSVSYNWYNSDSTYTKRIPILMLRHIIFMRLIAIVHNVRASGRM